MTIESTQHQESTNPPLLIADVVRMFHKIADLIDTDVNNVEILEELTELNIGLVKLIGIHDVSGSFSDWYTRGFKDGLDHRSLKCKCGKI